MLFYFKSYLVLVFVISNLCSCKKWLDKRPDTSVAEPKTVQDLQAILDNSQIMNEGKTSSYSLVSSDDYFLISAIVNSLSEDEQFSYTWRLTKDLSLNDWRSAYVPIYYANVCLNTIDKISKTSLNILQWNNVKGSALFFRAYYYLNLCWTYAKTYDSNTAHTDLGIVLRTSIDFNVPSERATVEDSYRKIIGDVKESVQYLPNISQHPFRPSKAASYGLLARAYLSMREYDSAFKYSELCLQIKNDLMDYNSDADIIGDINGTIPTFRKFNKETIFYSEIAQNNSYCYALDMSIDTGLYQSYQDNDLRKSIFFTPQNGYQTFKGSYTQSISYFFSGIAVDEMFLIRAECNARKNRISDAVNDLDSLLKKRWKIGTLPQIIVNNAQEALDITLKERRKELIMRGYRWMDIKRLNKDGHSIKLKRVIDNQVYELEPNDDRYALPLPADIITITGMPQNPPW